METERETDRHRETETDRQTQRHIERDIQRETYRERGRERDRETERERERQRDRERKRETERQRQRQRENNFSLLVSAQPTFTCSKSIIKTKEQDGNLFKVNNKDTRTTSLVSLLLNWNKFHSLFWFFHY